MNDPVDVLIVGGGLVGASLAVALAPLPLRVALVEAVAFDAPAQPSFDERTTALSNASRRVFEALELWRDISPAATPIERIHISDRGRFGFARIEAAQQGLDALGYVVPNRVLGRVLWPALQARPRLSVYAPAEVVRIEPGPDSVAVEIRRADGATAAIGARLVVAADGAKSAVRAAFGVSSQVRDYGQTAVITTVQPQQFHGFTAYERFTDEGPLALLPLADGRCGAVLTLAHARARQALGWSDAQYLAELQSRFGFRLGRFVKAGRRVSYPLALMQSAATSAPRCIIMGNAAQATPGRRHGLQSRAARCRLPG
ncbi:MAG: FAD-dependent monooxygenase [Steroidobacteraceae bacterium]